MLIASLRLATVRGVVVPCARVRGAASAAFYRPLPEISVSWKATLEDMSAARTSAMARNMRFNEADAETLITIHQDLSQMRARHSELEFEQRRVGSDIPRLAKQGRNDTSCLVPLDKLRERARELRTELRELEKRIDAATSVSLSIRNTWPNRMHDQVPIGPEEASRVLAVRDARAQEYIATPLPPLTIPCTAADMAEDKELQVALVPNAKRDHLALAQKLHDGDVDMAAGITTTGPSWPYLLGSLSILEHAISQYALALAYARGFVPVSTPDVVKTDVAERCGFRPRDEAAAQTYFVDTQRDTDEAALCLAGTAEIPLAALMAKQTFRDGDERSVNTGNDVSAFTLPVKLTALGHAYRAEAGARGTDTRGLYRIHQFSKAELFVVTAADKSDAMLEELRGVQEDMVSGLGLLYRYVPG